ncbi:O-methyltransferase [Pseudalkalibacillus salsuginis]|uniref:O-methyltransferase n=1 Tax=Pseudalkalibacillus salsuginis TaxID=2910972 RepID=UPI001F472AAC|nr:O-methyltransferase [Pseudalkalibacillus salsuginis]MCF6408606.1 O-methyltransferase [Pseudalkalibacillus salsuginis]
MISEELKLYLERLIPGRQHEILHMEQQAQEGNVPIMDLIGMEALLQVMRLHKPKRILEIGTAIGYSAIRMVQAVPDSHVITVERDPERFSKAIDNIIEMELQSSIHVIEGDALEKVSQIEEAGPYDFIFIDAAKGQYKRFFQEFESMLVPGGVIVSDNVLFRGFVSKGNEEIETRRFRKLADKIRDYNEFLMDQDTFHTTILPVGDGMAISILKDKV